MYRSFGSSYKSQSVQRFFLLVSEYSHTVSVSGIVPYILTAWWQKWNKKTFEINGDLDLLYLGLYQKGYRVFCKNFFLEFSTLKLHIKLKKGHERQNKVHGIQKNNMHQCKTGHISRNKWDSYIIFILSSFFVCLLHIFCIKILFLIHL